MKRLRSIVILLIIVALPAGAQWRSVGDVDSLHIRGQEVDCFAGGRMVRVSAVAEDLVRVRAVSGSAFPPDRSVAIARTDWPDLQTRITDGKDSVMLETTQLTVVIRKHPLRVRISGSDGTVLSEDAPRGMAWDGAEVRVWKVRPAEEYYFGLGEKTGTLNRTSKSFVLWNTDIPAYRADTDPVYQSIPFTIAIRNGRAHGIFFDNSYRSSFDFGVESSGRIAFGATGGEMNYNVFAGPTPRLVLQRYSELTGRMPLPPRWALGYQQCRWSYAPEAKVRQIAKTFRQKQIPCDVLYLDIDYMEGYRVFTWSAKNFPQPRKLLADLADDGFKVVTIIDPGIKADSSYHAYRSGLEADAFLRHEDGRTFLGKVWPGICAFPDFSKTAAREWWGKNFAGLLDDGVRGFWNDMNEPSVFDVPTKTADPDVMHDDGGLRTPHAKNHNTYGLLMTKGTYDGVRALRPNERPFVLTRATYAGGQRYSAAWTGDNVSSWEHLQMAVPMCLGLSISGQPFVGSDIGGFIGTPDGELFSRWLQFGVFSPLMRAHSVINSVDKEPWAYGSSYEIVNRKTIELRYRLLPYMYNAMVRASETGIPPMRPLIFDFPSDGAEIWNDTEFMFGEDLLIAPVLWPGERQRELHLPAGVWYDYWTNVRYDGGGNVNVPAPIDRIPIFVRAGAIVPSQQPVQYSDEAPIDPLTLTVYPADSSTSQYYGDDGESFAYQSGVYLKRKIEQRRSEDLIRIAVGKTEGSFPAPQRFIDVRVVGVDAEPRAVRLNGKPVFHMRGNPRIAGWYRNPVTKVLMVRMVDVPGAMDLVASMTGPVPGPGGAHR
jgi:alpha-glucosidase